MSQFSSDVFARVMRLVVPMRREFGKNLDVQDFLYDPAYAEEVLNLAISSRNEKVKDAAECLWPLVFGSRQWEAASRKEKSAASEKPQALRVVVAPKRSRRKIFLFRFTGKRVVLKWQKREGNLPRSSSARWCGRRRNPETGLRLLPVTWGCTKALCAAGLRS